MTDDYTDVVVKVVRLSSRAALLDFDGDSQWVPLSALGSGLAERHVGATLTVEIAAWKAEELGWA